jgi:hypothetical protein
MDKHRARSAGRLEARKRFSAMLEAELRAEEEAFGPAPRVRTPSKPPRRIRSAADWETVLSNLGDPAAVLARPVAAPLPPTHVPAGTSEAKAKRIARRAARAERLRRAVGGDRDAKPGRTRVLRTAKGPAVPR